MASCIAIEFEPAGSKVDSNLRPAKRKGLTLVATRLVPSPDPRRSTVAPDLDCDDAEDLQSLTTTCRAAPGTIAVSQGGWAARP